eukprot:COSAG02_NODE_1035_length_15053_cov_60.180019_15_plen_69_part_01
MRGDGNPFAGMTEMDKLEIQASGSALETMSSIVDMGGAGNIGMQASLPDRPICPFFCKARRAMTFYTTY